MHHAIGSTVHHRLPAHASKGRLPFLLAFSFLASGLADLVQAKALGFRSQYRNNQCGANHDTGKHQEDIPKICQEIDVAIIPSVFAETYSLVLSEMWMGGIPVIMQRNPTLRKEPPGQARLLAIHGRRQTPAPGYESGYRAQALFAVHGVLF